MTHRAFRRLGFTLLVLASARARAADEVWKGHGPERMYVRSIAVDPSTQTTLYAAGGSSSTALARSTDGGVTWVDLGWAGPRFDVLRSVVVDPAEPATLYLAVENDAIYKSIDGGISWKKLGLRAGTITLSLDPKHPGTLYAGLRQFGFDGPGLYKSTNGGADWIALDSAPPHLDVLAIAFDPAATDTLYVATYGSGAFKSTDGGKILKPINVGLPAPDVSFLAVDPRASGTIYAGVSDQGVFKSTDAGKTWSVTGPGFWYCGEFAALTIDARTTPSTVYALSECGISRSRDGGDHWTAMVAPPAIAVLSIAITTTNPATLYAGTFDMGVFALQLEAVAPPPPPASWLLPSSARVTGAHGASYTTDLTIANRGATDASLTIQFLGHDGDGRTGPVSTRQLASNRAVTYADVLGSLFGVPDGYGALRVTSDSASLKIAGVTSTPTPDGHGTVGQIVPAFTEVAFATPGAPRSLIGLREDAAFRTNLVLANASEFAVQVVLSLVGSDGVTLGTATRELPPLGMTQVPSVVTALGAGFGTRDAVLVVTPTTADARVAAYATVTDNVTNDPRTVLP